MRKLSLMALAMTLFVFACTKVAEEHGKLSDLQVKSRAPNGWTPPIPTAYEDWFYGDNQIRFCDGLGWNCWPSPDPDNSDPYWLTPKSLAWPLTTQGDNTGPMVELQWETAASLRMHILTDFPSYEEVLRTAGGDANAARWAYDLMRTRVNVPLPVVLDPKICAMLFDEDAGQRIALVPGEYSINEGEVVIPVEVN